MKALFLLAGVALISAPLLLFGTVSPCGIVRAEVRQAAQREGGLGGVLAAALPDQVIDGILAAQVGPLSPGRCVALAVTGLPAEHTPATPSAPTPQPFNPPVPPPIFTPPYSPVQDMSRPAAQADAAIAACKNKRLSGELQSHLQSANCSAPKIINAYETAGFRYMDLIFQITAKRAALARAIDADSLSETQAQVEYERFMTGIKRQERERDARQR